MSASTSGGCWHCGEPLPPGDAIEAIVAGVAHPVCCNGCRAAAEWISTLGLADYYRLRSAPAPRPASIDAAEHAAAWMRPELARVVVREMPGDRCEAIMAIDGMRCAACTWLIERALGSLPGVEAIRVNASARRARI